jgi:hypothetical protein
MIPTLNASGLLKSDLAGASPTKFSKPLVPILRSPKNNDNSKNPTKRLDARGIPIVAGKKAHSISFSQKNLTEVNVVENWKQHNIIPKKTELNNSFLELISSIFSPGEVKKNDFGMSIVFILIILYLIQSLWSRF